MNGISCDMCGGELLVDDEVRYVVEIQVYAAYDPLELTYSDLEGDLREKIRRIVRRMERMDAKEAEESVYKHTKFDLCSKCRKIYIASPLPRGEL